jgi:uridine kinase
MGASSRDKLVLTVGGCTFLAGATMLVVAWFDIARRIRGGTQKEQQGGRKEHLAQDTSSSSELLSSLRDMPLPKSMQDPSKTVADPIVRRVLEKVHDGQGSIVVGIAGGTGSGKTSLAQAVYSSLGKENVTYICHDSYYRDLSHLPVEERAKNNFDHPRSLETELLVEHLRQLKAGKAINVPIYDFTVHSRKMEVQVAIPRQVIIIEGILIFSDEDLLKEIDIKIFVDTDADVRFIRRLQRDVADRGRTVKSVIDQYLTFVRPMHEQFVEPARARCDLIVPVGLNQIALVRGVVYRAICVAIVFSLLTQKCSHPISEILGPYC